MRKPFSLAGGEVVTRYPIGIEPSLRAPLREIDAVRNSLIPSRIQIPA